MTADPLHETVSSRCATCGGKLRYIAGSFEVQCVQCGQLASLPCTPPSSQTWRTVDETRSWLLAATAPVRKEATCAACGATSPLPATVVQALCPFCEGVIENGLTELDPAAVIPFALDRDMALKRLRSFLATFTLLRIFAAPSLGRRTELIGCYLPFLRGQTRLQANYSIVVQKPDIDGGSRTETHFGRVALDRAEVLLPAMKPLPNRRGALEVWDLNAAVAWHPGYAAGYHVERAAFDWHSLNERASEALRMVALKAALEQQKSFGGRFRKVDLNASDLRFQVILCPVWIGTIWSRGQAFPVAVNGQNGEIGGQVPQNWLFEQLCIAITIVIIAAFILIRLGHG